MPTLFGLAVDDATGTQNNTLYVRNGATYALSALEAKYSTDSGIANWHAGADRRHYLFFDDRNWPPFSSGNLPNQNGAVGRVSGGASGDFENNRLPIVSFKERGFSWKQVGECSATVWPGAFADITATAVQIANWQAAREGTGKWGATVVWSFHHEPNNDFPSATSGTDLADAATNWRAATQNIYNIFVNNGVLMWQGNSDFSTTQEGLILALDMVSGTTSGGHGTDIETWWGPTTTNASTNPGDTWMDAHCVMHAGDHYNRGPAFQRFSFTSQTFKNWSDAKKVYQTSQGRPFMTAIWETGVRDISFYTSDHSSWTATGLTRSEEAWVTDTFNYVKTSWPNLNLFHYWDAGGQFAYQLDNTQAKWDAFVAAVSDPYFLVASSPIPSTTPPSTSDVYSEKFTTAASSFTTSSSFKLSHLSTFICIENAQATSGTTDIPTLSTTFGSQTINWTQVATVQHVSGGSGYIRRISIFQALPITESGTITATFTNQQVNCYIDVIQFDEVINNCVVQAKTQTGNNVFGAQSVTLPATPQATSSTFLFSVINNNTGMTQDSGWTQLNVDTSTTPVTSILDAWIDAPESPAIFNITGATGRNYAVIVVEVGSVAATPVNTDSGFGYTF